MNGKLHTKIEFDFENDPTTNLNQLLLLSKIITKFIAIRFKDASTFHPNCSQQNGSFRV